MTEAEWLACEDPTPMLEFQRTKASDRKLRLFACGCYRQIWHLLTEKICQTIIEISERYADGLVKRQALSGARRRGRSPAAFCVAWDVADDSSRLAAKRTVGNYHFRRSIAIETWHRDQCALLRCIFGNPFRPAACPPSWRSDTALSLARQMYESRDFSAMPVLADALQDAGCDSGDILDHCRGPGPHVRGCFVVDLLLGKE